MPRLIDASLNNIESSTLYPPYEPIATIAFIPQVCSSLYIYFK